MKSIHDKGYKADIKTAQVDADDVEQLKALFNSFKPELVINLALPYQDLTIMEACLACGCNYLDTANYEPKDEAHFEYSWQWATKTSLSRQDLLQYLVADSILACHRYSLPMQQSTISTKFTTLTSWIATLVITIKHLLQTSIQK